MFDILGITLSFFAIIALGAFTKYIGSAADGSLGYLYILTYFVILILNITNAQKIYNL